jgi:uroporphyrinogen decarboxylase
MGIDFSISESGNISIDPIQTRDDFHQRLRRVTKVDYETSCSFVGQVLTQLRHCLEYDDTTSSSSDGTEKGRGPPTVLGFVGLPFTLASYVVEGKTGHSTGFPNLFALQDTDPTLLHDILTRLSDNIADYACFQIASGAQVLQVFDSWAGHLDDERYTLWCMPYQKAVIAKIKQYSPTTPIIIYMAPCSEYSSGGRRLAQLAATGADMVSVDHTIDMAHARQMIPNQIGMQGNLDPQLLRDGPLEAIEQQTKSIMDSMVGRSHIMNLGHGILADTPEAHAAFFVKTVQQYRPKGKL